MEEDRLQGVLQKRGQKKGEGASAVDKTKKKAAKS